jgi:predicted CoA-binding protein
MNHDRYDDAYIAAILHRLKVVAMVGASANINRPSYFVMKYLLGKGFAVIPVNPGLAGQEILGQKVVASLADIDQQVDMVDVFRNSEAALGIVRECIALKDKLALKVIWMQLSVRNDEAAAEAEAAGLKVVMNRCPKIEYGRLSSEIAWMGVNTRTISAKKAMLPAHGIQRLSLNRATMTGGATEAATRAQRIEPGNS